MTSPFFSLILFLRSGNHSLTNSGFFRLITFNQQRGPLLETTYWMGNVDMCILACTQSLDGDKEGAPSINNSVVFKHFRFGESGDPDPPP